jgi:hypothetical protein
MARGRRGRNPVLLIAKMDFSSPDALAFKAREMLKQFGYTEEPRPIKDQPGQGLAVLVTAAHVLDGIKGDTATMTNSKTESGCSYLPFDY